MTRPSWGTQSWVRLAVAVGALLAVASPAWAECKPNTSSPLDWDRCWSLLRLGIWAFTLPLGWGLCFHVLFPAKLQPERKTAPWPRTAYGQCLSWFCVLAAASFLLLFGVVSDELHHPPGTRFLPASRFGNVINLHWPWMAVILGTALVFWLIRWRVRHHEERTA